MATKTNAAKNVRLRFEFEKTNRISSLVIKPYDINNYPSKIKMTCINGSASNLIYNQKVRLKRSMIVLNLFGDDYCDKLEIDFSDFVGQNRLLIRDITIIGK
jgi:hypothetical protein